MLQAGRSGSRSWRCPGARLRAQQKQPLANLYSPAARAQNRCARPPRRPHRVPAGGLVTAPRTAARGSLGPPLSSCQQRRLRRVLTRSSPRSRSRRRPRMGFDKAPRPAHLVAQLVVHLHGRRRSQKDRRQPSKRPGVYVSDRGDTAIGNVSTPIEKTPVVYRRDTPRRA